MAWRRPGDKPLSEAMMASFLTHICVTRPQWVRPMLKDDQEDNISLKSTILHANIYYSSIQGMRYNESNCCHDDVIKWKHFLRYWPFVRGIHRSPVNSPHKGQWCRALMFSLICIWINGWVNNAEAGDLRCYRVHYDVTVMLLICVPFVW